MCQEPTRASIGGGARPKKAQDYAFAGDWDGYFVDVRGKPARETLVKALELFDAERNADAEVRNKPRFAVDLACGEGRDTYELLRQGWEVLAIDPSQTGLRLVREGLLPEWVSRCRLSQADFGSARWPACQLLNASFALPFCPREDWDGLWTRVSQSIAPGGRFSGQFFGDRDSWARCGRTLGLTRGEVGSLLSDFELEHFNEEEKDDQGGAMPKHWHVFHVVARKRCARGIKAPA